MFTNGCGKQHNKGRRIFRFLADNVRQIGFFIYHHLAATFHFKGGRDGIGGVAKIAMKRREIYHLAEGNTPKYDGETTTDNLKMSSWC